MRVPEWMQPRGPTQNGTHHVLDPRAAASGSQEGALITGAPCAHLDPHYSLLQAEA